MQWAFLSLVEDLFEIFGRGVVVAPGIPKTFKHSVNVGDLIQIRRADGIEIETSIFGIEMLGRPLFDDALVKRNELGTPILLGPQIRKIDLPVSSELWWQHSEGE